MGNPALDEFRAVLAERLATALPGVTPDAIDAAITALTRDFRASHKDTMIKDSAGIVQDGMDLAGPVVGDVTPMVALTATFTMTREQTDTERNVAAERLVAALWEPKVGPPPDRVSTMQLLEQRIWWRPRSRDPIRLDDMRPTHREHLLAFLRRSATRYKNQAELRMLSLMSGPFGPQGEAACDAVDSIIDELAVQKPEDWVNEQPLVRRLAKMIRRDRKWFVEAMDARGVSPDTHCSDCWESLDSDAHKLHCEEPRAARIADEAASRAHAKAALEASRTPADAEPLPDEYRRFLNTVSPDDEG